MQVALGSLVITNVGIALGSQESGAIQTGGLSLCAVSLPAVFTGVALTFEAADSLAGTYKPIVNKAGPVSYTVAAGQFLAVDPQDFYGVQFLKIKSGSAEAAARTLVCSMKGI